MGQRNVARERGPSFEELREALPGQYTSGDRSLIERAYQTAKRVHEGQRRRSGHPYITHPLVVAGIVADADASVNLVCAALLHDVVEGGTYSAARLRNEFGAEVAELVESLHRRDAVRQPECASEVAQLALADRLHNIRTLRFLGQPQQRRIARETLDVYVPLAERLALPGLRRELADLATAALGWAELRRRAASPGQRLLAAGAMLLPGDVRMRWFEEWQGELGVLPTRRARARFAIQTLRGLPRLVVTVRLRP